jgi:hypothetical protein
MLLACQFIPFFPDKRMFGLCSLPKDQAIGGEAL